MTHNNIVYLVSQIIDIALILMLIIYVLIQYKKRKYSLYYAVARFIFHRDKTYLRWFNKNPIYLHYLMLVSCLLMTEAGLLQQIADKTLYTKPIIFFFAYTGIAISTILVMSELLKKIKTQEKA